MDATSFELSLSMPREARFTDMVRRLAVQAARYAECQDGQDDAFGQTVVDAFEACLAASDLDVPILFRRASGPVEAHVDGRVLTLTI
jgi:hypothetical protein